MAPSEIASLISKDCAEARAVGNAAYVAGDLERACSAYKDALDAWEAAMHGAEQPQELKVGQLVRYSEKGYFGTVMSCYPLFDEYFLKDLGSEQAIWVGEPGGTLRRFSRKELVPLDRELVDFRLAVLQNLAAVSLRQENWEQTVRWADAALAISGRAPKALMRKGSALLRLNLPGPASDVLATAAEEVPNDAEVKRLLREAEKRRSPTWVCVTGCCGPWGIVCGGPVAEVMPQVVAPAEKRVADNSQAALVAPGDADDARGTPAAIAGDVGDAAPAEGADGAAKAALAPPDGGDELADSERPESQQPRRRLAASVAADDGTGSGASGADRTGADGSGRHTATCGSTAFRMDRGVSALLWIAVLSGAVAVAAGVWLVSVPGDAQR